MFVRVTNRFLGYAYEMDIWRKVQFVWQYLGPIFGSDDFMKRMPNE